MKDYLKALISITSIPHKKMRLVNELQKLTNRGNKTVVNSHRTFHREMEQEGRTEEVQTGPESESVNEKLREGIIKGRTVPKICRTVNRDVQ